MSTTKDPSTKTSAQAGALPTVLALDDPRAQDAHLCGAKAAALATAAEHELPVLPGFVLTTAAEREGDQLGSEVHQAWSDLSGEGSRSLVVRSSSTVEDLAQSSMAGRYKSVVGVMGWDAFVKAITSVLASRARAAEGTDELTGNEPMAVLVQPLLDATAGGVLFGVDPVSGRTDHLVVVASTEGPDAVVSGRVAGSRYVLDLEGRVVSTDHGFHGARLGRRQRAALVRLARATADVLAGPQDVEWAFDHRGKLILLQSRSVTTEVIGVPVGPVLGPGPVSETFPDALAPLEEDLWVEPLRQALRQSLRLVGAASEAELDASPVVVCIGGHVAIDLELTGSVPRPSPPSRLDPRPQVRRLRSAWRVGRLRAALPSLAEDVVASADAALFSVPPLNELSDRQLIALLDRGVAALVSAHAHEVLIGQLIASDTPLVTGSAVALRVLADARERGTPDEEIIARHPVVLAITSPRIGPAGRLPQDVEAPAWVSGTKRDRSAVLREALRLRVRWFQELTGRAAWELGERLVERGVLDHPLLVRRLRRPELTATVLGRAVPIDLFERHPPDDDFPLPAQFRLTESGRAVVVASDHDDGTGAGGGRAQGRVVHDVNEVHDGDVLVVRTLEPSLALVLPHLAGLVAETGSVLAHMAILARECGLPTVVGFNGALDRFPQGTIVEVDGREGMVRLVAEET